MRRLILTTTLILTVVAGTVLGVPRNAESPRLDGGGKRWLIGDIQLGYYQGVGVHISATAMNFAQDFPFSVRLGIGYAHIDGGDEWAARRVFINDNTNGTARSSTHVWDGRLDVICPVKLLDLKRTNIFAGPRYSDFNAYFEYIGGAETFDVMSNQWGLGGGIETMFALSPRVDMKFTLGADYYFRSTLSGHDTYYRPDGNDTHPIDEYTYKDADAAINQPDVMTRLMVGLSYHF